jgi:hypothetical protein
MSIGSCCLVGLGDEFCTIPRRQCQVLAMKALLQLEDRIRQLLDVDLRGRAMPGTPLVFVGKRVQQASEHVAGHASVSVEKQIMGKRVVSFMTGPGSGCCRRESVLHDSKASSEPLAERGAVVRETIDGTGTRRRVL